MRVTILNSVACEELAEKVSFRQRLKGDERATQVSGRRMMGAREKKQFFKVSKAEVCLACSVNTFKEANVA